jgi:hypothetical protein
MVAAFVGLLSAVAVGVFGVRFFGPRFLIAIGGWKYLVFAFLSGGGLVLLAADRLGLLSAPYSDSTHYGLDGRVTGMRK